MGWMRCGRVCAGIVGGELEYDREVLSQGTCAVARMAKSADAADLKSAGRKAVGVQVPLRAPGIQQVTTASSDWPWIAFRR